MINATVSVIVTTYKREPKMVKRAVDSILNQSYKELEVIVVDDSPPDYCMRDEVRNTIESMGDRVRYISHKKNLGACAARNTGIENAHGEFVAFLDDDDEWLPTKLEKQMLKFDYPKVGLVYCASFKCYDNGVRETKKLVWHADSIFIELLRENFIGSTSFVVVRKDIVIEAGMFDENMKSAQDYDMWVRVVQISDIDYVDEPLVNYYVHDGENISGNPKNKVQGLERFNQKYWEFISKDDETKWIRIIKLAPMYAWDGQYLKAIKTYITAVVIKPFNFVENIKYFKRTVQYAIYSIVKK